MDLEYYKSQFKRAILDNRGLAAEGVRFGASVKARKKDGALKEYRIAGGDEAGPAAGKLNRGSPVASALMCAKPGARMALARKGGSVRVEFLSACYHRD